MLVVCIDDRTRDKKRRVLDVGKTYEAYEDESRPNCYKVIIDKENKTNRTGRTTSNTKYLKKSRFIVKSK